VVPKAWLVFESDFPQIRPQKLAGVKLRGEGEVKVALISGAFALSSAVALAAAPARHNPDCRVSSQSAVPPYSITISCRADCRHIPKLRTIRELVAAGVDPMAAPGVVAIQTGYWHRACPAKQAPSN